MALRVTSPCNAAWGPNSPENGENKLMSRYHWSLRDIKEHQRHRDPEANVYISSSSHRRARLYLAHLFYTRTEIVLHRIQSSSNTKSIQFKLIDCWRFECKELITHSLKDAHGSGSHGLNQLACFWKKDKNISDFGFCKKNEQLHLIWKRAEYLDLELFTQNNARTLSFVRIDFVIDDIHHFYFITFMTKWFMCERDSGVIMPSRYF